MSQSSNAPTIVGTVVNSSGQLVITVANGALPPPSPPPPPPPPSVSSDGSTLMAGASGSLVTSAGTWTFSTATAVGGNLILLNGQPVGGGSAVEMEVAKGGNLFVRNAQAQWYEWVGSSWTPSADPTPAPPVAVSISGVALNNTFFPSGLPAGTVVGKVSVTLSNGSAFAGALAVTGSTQFQIASGTLITNAVVANGTYHFNIVPTQAGLVGSGNAFPVTVVAGKVVLDVNNQPLRTNNNGYVPAI